MFSDSQSHTLNGQSTTCVEESSLIVQIDDRISKSVSISFGVPQGSIMGPLIFNIYIADLQEKLDCACHQYADDTTVY